MTVNLIIWFPLPYHLDLKATRSKISIFPSISRYIVNVSFWADFLFLFHCGDHLCPVGRSIPAFHKLFSSIIHFGNLVCLTFISFAL